jgi:hypothetical protein
VVTARLEHMFEDVFERIWPPGPDPASGQLCPTPALRGTESRTLCVGS